METTQTVIRMSTGDFFDALRVLALDVLTLLKEASQDLALNLGNFRKEGGGAYAAQSPKKSFGSGGGGSHHDPEEDEDEEFTTTKSSFHKRSIALSDAARIMRTSRDPEERHRAAQLLGAAGGHARGISHHVSAESEEDAPDVTQLKTGLLKDKHKPSVGSKS